MSAAIIFIALIVLIFACSGRSSATRDNSQNTPSRPQEPRSRTKYIDKHLHRDDAKHARHKQNQTPW